jgi:hypothetical protein
MCFFVYDSEGSNGMHNSRPRPSNPSKFLNTAARVWFKTQDDWAIFSSYKEKQTDPWSFIKEKLFKNFDVVYCFAESIDCQTAKIAVPYSSSENNLSYIVYNQKYSLKGDLIVTCKIPNIKITQGESIICNKGQGSENKQATI